MSCFIVDPYHVDILVGWAAARGASCFHRPHTPSSVAALLADANAQAYTDRYGEIVDRDYKYTFRDNAGHTPTVQIIKACDCLTYQCSDWALWETSTAHAVLTCIRDHAIRQLPGYDEAAWCLAEEVTA